MDALRILIYIRKLKLPSILDELLRCHWLFFGRDIPSKKHMQSDFKGIELELVSDYCDRYRAGVPSVHMRNFPIYGSRLQTIHQRLREWQPQYGGSHSQTLREYRRLLCILVRRFCWSGESSTISVGNIQCLHKRKRKGNLILEGVATICIRYYYNLWQGM